MTCVYSAGLLLVGVALVDRLQHARRPVPTPFPVTRAEHIAPAAPAVMVALPAEEQAPAEPIVSLNTASAAEVASPPENPPLLIATAKVTSVFSKPNVDSSKLGYLRTGAVLRRSAEPVGFTGCKAGWYEVSPQGYVCIGRAASLEVDSPLKQATARRPERDQALPYQYGRSRTPPPPFYTRVPSEAEQRQIEPDLAWHMKNKKDEAWRSLRLDPVPGFLAEGQPSLRHNGTRQSALVLSEGQAVPKSGFGLLDIFESSGRAFGLTTDLSVVPLDRLDRVEPSRFHGLPLVAGAELPVVFVRTRTAWLYDGDPVEGLEVARQLENREALSITGRRERIGAKTFLETRAGQWLVDEKLTRIDALPEVPFWGKDGKQWIDVSIDNQTLVAYEGGRPVFATLVSTGVDGLGDPDTTHSTIQGRFLIHTKHVSATMDGDEVGDEYDLRDVPYVQYFHEGYALHGVYWHDNFGTPKSHGCVNLSPLDARWLFSWTTPTVPTAWHGAMSRLGGTLVSIRP